LNEQIYEMLYLQKVSDDTRHRLLANTGIENTARRANGEIELTMRDMLTGHAHAERFDALVLATGYRRDTHLALLDGLAPHLDDALAQGSVGRDYRLVTPANFKPRIYLQGCCEESHGLSDTLLSVLAVRSDEIAASLADAGQDNAATQAAATKQTGVSGGRVAVAL
jgi:L-ornithine N5-oxygenase